MTQGHAEVLSRRARAVRLNESVQVLFRRDRTVEQKVDEIRRVVGAGGFE